MNKRILLLFISILAISLFCRSLTSAESPKNYLKGKFYSTVKNNFLIATKKMTDDRFKKTVIVMLENDKDGAWGIVVNKYIGSLPISLFIDLSLNNLKENEKLQKVNIPIFWGGPVEAKKMFIMHSNEYQSKSTVNYGKISISQDYDILIDIARNKGPEKNLIVFGYSGWGDGQLEGEMERDHWILSDIDLDIIFDKEITEKWNKAYKNSFIKI